MRVYKTKKLAESGVALRIATGIIIDGSSPNVIELPDDKADIRAAVEHYVNRGYLRLTKLVPGRPKARKAKASKAASSRKKSGGR